jgi:hypothetical protein
MKSVLLVGVVAVALSGCTSLVEAQNTCSAQNPSYISMWGCIRGKVAANQAGAMNNDLGVRYMAYGDLLQERVRAGQMTDAEAKAYLAKELSAANGEFEARKSRVIRDLAAIQAAQPQPSPTINCQSIRTGTIVNTTCN